MKQRSQTDFLPEEMSKFGSCGLCKKNIGNNSRKVLQCLHQGDPLAVFLYSVAAHPVVLRVIEEVPNLKQNAWFLDDGALAGNREDLKKVVDIIKEEGPQRGLNLSTEKSKVWCQEPKNDDNPLQQGIPLDTVDGLKLLGAPIGSTSFESVVLDDRIEKSEQLMQRLSILDDPYSEYVLLRNCLALPKMSYAIRTVNPVHHEASMERFDSSVRESLERILGGPISDAKWKQASLPVSQGGLGLRSALSHSAAAFISSFSDSQSIIEDIIGQPKIFNDEELLALLNSRSVGETEFSMEQAGSSSQKAMSQVIDSSLLNELKSQADNEREKARFNCVTMKHAGDWLNAVPVKSLGLHLQPMEFTTSVKYRLGIPVVQSISASPANAQGGFCGGKG